MSPDHLALDEGESVAQSVVPPARSKPVHLRLARAISNLLSPVAISLPFVALVALYRDQNSLAPLISISMTLFFLSVGPMIYILIGVRTGKFTDVDVSLRSQRVGPFLFCIGSAIVGLLALTLAHGPKNLQTLFLLTIISGTIMLIITYWWKISMHASSLAGALTMLTMLYGRVVLPTFVLLIAVCWSRVVLRRHTVAQVIAGSCVSIALTSLVLLVRGV